MKLNSLDNAGIEKEKKSILNLDELLDILGNSTRRVILSKLAKVPHTTSELARSLDISRQAVHSQLKILIENNIIENLEGGVYRINSNLSFRIDITPDYYNVDFNTSLPENKPYDAVKFKENEYRKIKAPNEKLRYIGEKLKGIEYKLNDLEGKRRELLQNKEGLIVELKNIMREQYEEKLRQEQPHLEKEIFYTIFYDPMKYFKQINIDHLVEDMFFSNMDIIRLDQTRVSIKHLLRDLSKFMDIFKEVNEDWFFDL